MVKLLIKFTNACFCSNVRKIELNKGRKAVKFMLNEMIEAVKTAEKQAADRILEAKKAAAHTAESAEVQKERMRAEVCDNGKAYYAGLKESIKSEEERLLREAEEKAKITATQLRENAAKKQSELDKMMLDILFS